MKKSRSVHSHILVKLGLTAHESECYTLLLRGGALSAKEIAEKTDIVVNAMYRTLNALEQKGFVTSLPTHPRKFQALPPSIAVEAFSTKQEKRLKELKMQSIQSLTQEKAKAIQTRIAILTGRTAMFNKFSEMAADAKEEILVISIGESVPDEVKLAHRDAKDRKVSQKLLFHRSDENNREILRSWVKMGIEVRHYPDWGFHLMVFDGKRSILVTNNPEETEERTGMIIHSEGLSKTLRDYFYSIWEKAIPIEV